jgi:putative hydrolase
MDQSQSPFDGLLGDLLKILGGQGGGTPWFESARALAVGVASEGQAEANPDPLERIALEKLLDVALRHVEEVTGQPSSEPISINPVTRASWAVAQLDAWRPTIEKVVEAQAQATGASLAQLSSEQGPEGVPAIFGQFANLLGPMLLGLQFGSAAGHLAERTLGNYALPLPWPEGAPLTLVPVNLERFAEDWSLPLDEVRLFALTRELAGHSAFGNDSIARRVNELLEAAMSDALAAQSSIIERMTSSGDPEALSAMLSDPDAMLAELVSPGAHATSSSLTAATTALGAYLDHVADVVTERLTASSALLKEAWHRHRVTDAKGEQAAGGLFGLDLSAREVERGQLFVSGVLERQGEVGLAKLLRSGTALPTAAELDAPGLWLERLSLPELNDGPA